MALHLRGRATIGFMRRLLAISGKRFSGKDTFASLLQQEARERGLRLETYAFAAECKRLFVAKQAKEGVVVELERLTTDRAYKETWRPKLTEFTVASIAADPLIFCREVARRIEASTDLALITDLRLKLELEHLRPRFDLHVMRLVRTDPHRTASGWVYKPEVDGHHTETELDDPALWDETVPNDDSVDELRTRATSAINWLLR
jgi:phosphomevalonate kinase